MPAPHQYGPSEYQGCTKWACLFGGCAFAFVVSSVSLIVCAFVIARPAIPALSFQKTNCTAINYTYLGTRECECGGLTNDRPNCKSTFPCIRIHVQYEFTGFRKSNETFAGEKVVQAVLHEHESTAYSSFTECAIFSCNPKLKANQLEVDSFLRDYGTTNQSFPCYFDKQNLQTAILKRNYTLLDVVLALAVPGGFFIIFLITVIILCLIRCTSKTKPPPKTRVHRGYMNPSVLVETNEAANVKERPLPGPGSSDTYNRQSDPSPPETESTAM